jgi:hypothetical protein
MDESQLAAITAWVTKTGLAGGPAHDNVRGFLAFSYKKIR